MFKKITAYRIFFFEVSKVSVVFFIQVQKLEIAAEQH